MIAALLTLTMSRTAFARDLRLEAGRTRAVGGGQVFDDAERLARAHYRGWRLADEESPAYLGPFTAVMTDVAGRAVRVRGDALAVEVPSPRGHVDMVVFSPARRFPRRTFYIEPHLFVGPEPALHFDDEDVLNSIEELVRRDPAARAVLIFRGANACARALAGS